MNLKKLILMPSIIASIIVVISYLLLPMWSVKQVNEDGDTQLGVSASGLQTLTNSLSVSGETWDDAKDKYKKKMKKKAIEAVYETTEKCKTCRTTIGLIDKLTVFILLGALFLISGPVMKSLDKDIPFLNERNMNWAKKILLIITGFFFVRYGFGAQIAIVDGIIYGLNWGMYIMFIAAIFISYENKIMTFVSKQIKKK